MDSPRQEFGPSDWAIVALLAEHPSHGWALAEKLKPNGEIGAVWSLARPAVYRSLENLKKEGLVETMKLEQSDRGPYREVYRATRRGRAGLKAWLAEPVEHVREIRSIFLLKLVLSARAGIDRTPMIRTQRAVIADLVTGQEERPDGDSEAERLAVRFRVDAGRAVLTFLDDLLETDAAVPGRLSPSRSEHRVKQP